nr:zinc finger, CCHC-type [Tanacetum cinerariifolium]
MDNSLLYAGYPSLLEGYTDASWISNTEDSSSTSGWVILLGRGAISWVSKKQTCIISSTMEYEYVALAATAFISIYCNSVAILVNAYSQMYSGKSGHLGVSHNIIHELIMNALVSIDYVMSQQNLTNHLMDGMTRDLVLKSAKGMGKSNIVTLDSKQSSPKEKEEAKITPVAAGSKRRVMAVLRRKAWPPHYETDQGVSSRRGMN